jgi:hypothetical protein
MEWLDGVLADAQAKGQKVVIFSHHPFSGCFIFPHTNSDEMQALLAKYKKTGVLCINGDLHAEFYAGIKGVIYYGMTSSTFFNFGLDDNGRPTRVYPDDVTYEYIEFDAEGNEIGRRERRVNELANDHIYYCAEPLSAIVTITDTGALFIEGMNAGWLAGYAERANLSAPTDLPRRMSAAAQRLSKVPPAHPAITPWSTRILPVAGSILSVSLSVPGARPSCASPSISHLRRISAPFSQSSRIVYVLEGWKGRAIIGSTRERSISTAPS